MTLTPKACSVHTHADLCDGRDSLEAMAAAAFDAGVRYYGVSCHSHTPLATDEGFTLPANMMEYRRQVLAVREQYRGRMEVLLGLEWDSQSDVSPEGFDYWIGSVHYQRGENGIYYAADWGPEHFAACRDELWGGDALAVAEGYFREAARVAAMRPTILGHLDLITKLNAGNRFFDEASPRYRAAALEALHAADPDATLLEINTGGVAGATGPRRTRRCFCCGSGAAWAAGSSSHLTPTARIACFTDTGRRPRSPGRRALPSPPC